jgi:hypothetical protein
MQILAFQASKALIGTQLRIEGNATPSDATIDAA